MPAGASLHHVTHGVCWEVVSAPSLLPSAGIVNMLSGVVLITTFVYTLRQVNRNNRLALAGRRAGEAGEVALAFSIHVTFLQLSSVWAVVWAAYKVFATDSDDTPHWHIYHAVADTSVLSMSTFLESAVCIYLYLADTGARAIRTTVTRALGLSAATFALLLGVQVQYPSSSPRGRSRQTLIANWTVVLVSFAAYGALLVAMARRSARRRDLLLEANDAYRPFVSFLAAYFFTSSVGHGLEFAGLDVAYCFGAVSLLAYFTLFALTLYRTLCLDSFYWQSKVMGGRDASASRRRASGFGAGEALLDLPGGPSDGAGAGDGALSVLPASYEDCMIPCNQLVLLRRLGPCAGGVVELQMWCGREVVVKKLRLQECGESQVRAFTREAGIQRQVRHPHVVEFLGVYFDPPALGIVLEYCPGGDLHAALAARNLRGAHPLEIAAGVARGMAYLHGRGLVHRDLKSLNVLLDARGSPRVADFGESEVAGKRAGGPRGTPAWMSPEAVVGRQVTSSSDVYSFGVLLWELLTWRDPVVAAPGAAPGGRHVGVRSLPDAELFVVQERMRPPVPRGCPPAVASLLALCFEETPEERPAFPLVVRTLEAALESAPPRTAFPLPLA